jgi:hypothetical protein
MRMRNLERRVHLLLDEDRYRKLEVEAKLRHVSVAAVIRDAIDRMPSDLDRRRQAMEAILAAPGMPVPDDPMDIRRELDEAHDRVPR